MSIWSTNGNATLGEIIDYLTTLPRDQEIESGFGNPHSYRGYYEDLAFEPVENTTVGEMLDAARSAVGKTFCGWKGGEFTMGRDTDCWLAEVGCTGVPIFMPSGPRGYVLPIVANLSPDGGTRE